MRSETGQKRRILAYRMSLRDKFLPHTRRLLASLRGTPKTKILTAAAVGMSLIAFGAAGVAPDCRIVAHAGWRAALQRAPRRHRHGAAAEVCVESD